MKKLVRGKLVSYKDLTDDDIDFLVDRELKQKKYKNKHKGMLSIMLSEDYILLRDMLRAG